MGPWISVLSIVRPVGYDFGFREIYIKHQFMGAAMKKGFWGVISQGAVLLLAVAVCSVARADRRDSVTDDADSDEFTDALPPEAGSLRDPLADLTNRSDRGEGVSFDEERAGENRDLSPSVLPGAPAGQGGTGYRFTWAPDKWCNVGAGVRTTFNSVTQGAPGGGNSFQLNNMRLYTSGKVHEYVGFEFNTDVAENPFVAGNNNQIQLLDAVFKFEYNDLFNIWAGRFLPPSDRAVLSGPYFINAWDFPFVQNYTNIFAGRDDGVAYWGQYGGGQIQWSLGAFNGSGRTAASGELTTPNGNGNVEFAMRVEVNLLDPEPGYYKQGTYYGEKDLLSIGYALQTQSSAVGTAANAQHATCWNIDVLFENKMTEWGSATIEGAFYHYNAINTAGLSVIDPFVARPGDSGFIYAGWLTPREIGIGRFRPFVRYLKYNYDNLLAAAAQADASQGWDAGVDYVIKGHSARLTAFWGQRDVVGFGRENLLRTGAQVNF